ncbi:hypothetical protein DFH05DRAFT_659956 [Lentinula detonsa]|uniref:Uncharacterized protein n=1 Tax=Lentinula detonsa TaxID=2804962 RepID=A0A9W8P8T8_9AGAR|nr:hypothetical protein DFH05DRAFT_659956 [Lentinula detonsa]
MDAMLQIEHYEYPGRESHLFKSFTKINQASWLLSSNPRLSLCHKLKFREQLLVCASECVNGRRTLLKAALLLYNGRRKLNAPSILINAPVAFVLKKYFLRIGGEDKVALTPAFDAIAIVLLDVTMCCFVLLILEACHIRTLNSRRVRTLRSRDIISSIFQFLKSSSRFDSLPSDGLLTMGGTTRYSNTMHNGIFRQITLYCTRLYKTSVQDSLVTCCATYSA